MKKEIAQLWDQGTTAKSYVPYASIGLFFDNVCEVTILVVNTRSVLRRNLKKYMADQMIFISLSFKYIVGKKT